MHGNRLTQLNQALEQIVSTLITEYQPEKIIVFGSVADGTVGEWSDLDLVIIKETTMPFVQRSEEVALLCMAPVGVDYMVYTPSEYAHMLNEQNPFVMEEIEKKEKSCMSTSLPHQWLDKAQEDLTVAQLVFQEQHMSHTCFLAHRRLKKLSKLF